MIRNNKNIRITSTYSGLGKVSMSHITGVVRTIKHCKLYENSFDFLTVNLIRDYTYRSKEVTCHNTE